MDELLRACNDDQGAEVWKSVLNLIKEAEVQYLKERINRIMRRRFPIIRNPEEEDE
jgi:hypothetical protein